MAVFVYRPTLTFVSPLLSMQVALCGAPPLHSPRSLLCLANNRVLRHTFAAMRARFYKLYRVRAHLHHYTKFVEEGDVAEALEGFDRMVSAYAGGRAGGTANGVSAAMLKPMF